MKTNKMRMRKGATILEVALSAVIITALAAAVIPTQLKNTRKSENSVKNTKMLSYEDAYKFTHKHINTIKGDGENGTDR